VAGDGEQPEGELRQTNPIRGADRVKRSQSPLWAGGVLVGTSRITPYGVTTNAGPIVQNEANLRRVAYPGVPLCYHSDVPVVRGRVQEATSWRDGA
jgi:hypothetical protein